jgi:hypothetical protein
MQKTYDESDYQMFPLIINGNNLVNDNGFNNTYRYVFPRGSVKFADSKIAIETISMYYSWQNISSTNQNNTFSFTFTQATPTTYNVVIPDGFYTVSDLNLYLQNYCVLNNLYLVNSTGDFVYYLQISENPTYYSVELTTFAFPTSLPVGWSNPAGMTFPATATTPQFIIPSTNIRNLLGFDAGIYPAVAQATDYSLLSTFTPQVSPVQSVIITCNLINNRFANPSTVFYNFSPAGVQYGSLIDIKPSEYAFINIQDGNYSSFDIVFLDQNFQPLDILDTNLVIQILCKSRVEKY